MPKSNHLIAPDRSIRESDTLGELGGNGKDKIHHSVSFSSSLFMTSDNLHTAYFGIRFRGPWPDLVCPGEFAIITAYATTGEVWSDQENDEADIALPA